VFPEELRELLWRSANEKRFGYVVVFASFAAGCRQENEPQAKLAHREEIAKHLPDGLQMTDLIPRCRYWDKKTKPGANAVSVEEKLLELGAHLDANGKLVDSEGWEIQFRKMEVPGPPPSKEREEQTTKEAERKRKEDLENKIRVITYEIDVGI
jgi:hypothetical protein